MSTTAYKIQCLPLTTHKVNILAEWSNEYAKVYNFAAQHIPSIRNTKYFSDRYPSKLYGLWIKSGIIQRKSLQAQSAFQAISDARANYKTAEAQHKINKTIPLVINKMENPNIIKFGNHGYHLVKRGDNYMVVLKGIIEAKIAVPLRIGSRQTELRALLDTAIENKKDIGIILYNLKNNTMSIPKRTEKIRFVKKDKIKTIIGVDRGVNNTVVLRALQVDDNSPLRDFEYKDERWRSLGGIGAKVVGTKIISGKPIIADLKRLKKINKKRQQARKPVGHRVFNIKESDSHQISSEIVDFALKFPVPTVVFENLKNIKHGRLRHKHGGKASKGQRRMMAQWRYNNLKNKTIYKLEAHGIWTLDIPPAFTSQNCSRCGAKGIRDGIHFHCTRCGLGCGSTPQSTIGQYNADVNAGTNIALRGFRSLYAIKKPGCGKGSIAGPKIQPDKNIQNPIPTEMMGADGTKSRRSENQGMPELPGMYAIADGETNKVGVASRVSEQPNAKVSVAGCAPENDFSSCYKRNNNLAGRTEFAEKISGGGMLSKSEF